MRLRMPPCLKAGVMLSKHFSILKDLAQNNPRPVPLGYLVCKGAAPVPILDRARLGSLFEVDPVTPNISSTAARSLRQTAPFRFSNDYPRAAVRHLQLAASKT